MSDTTRQNPDSHLLYEYTDKIPHTARIKVQLDETVDRDLLYEAAQEAIGRFPYFRVSLDIDHQGNYVLLGNDRPMAVLPEKDSRLVLGSEVVGAHLFAITFRDDCVWFSFPRSVCGAHGALSWVKSTLYQYLGKRYGHIEPPADLMAPGAQVEPAELSYPDVKTPPEDEATLLPDGEGASAGPATTLRYLTNPLARDSYYFEMDLPADDFIAYARAKEGSANTILSSLMFKACARYLKDKRKAGTKLTAGIAEDYRCDVGVPDSYRDLVRLIHVSYDRDMADDSVERLSLHTRIAILRQDREELGIEHLRQLERVRRGIDGQPTLRDKVAYASKNGTFRDDLRDTYTICYVGQVDWGGMEDHIVGVYTTCGGDLALEVNALEDQFCLSFQLLTKDQGPFERFSDVLREEGIPCYVSEQLQRRLPKIELPKPSRRRT